MRPFCHSASAIAQLTCSPLVLPVGLQQQLTLLLPFQLTSACAVVQLETAATAGVVLVLLLIGLLGVKAVEEGFPAIQNGELPLWSLKVDGHLPEAFSVVGYAFYMQPMMMPLLAEMPPGATGAVVMQKAVHVTLYGEWSCNELSTPKIPNRSTQ